MGKVEDSYELILQRYKKEKQQYQSKWEQTKEENDTSKKGKWIE